MDDDFDPYNQPARSYSVGRRDPFLVLSRTMLPAQKGRHSRPNPRITPVPTKPEPRRGVFEDDSPFPGTRTFAVVGSEGDRIATVTAVESIVDEAFARGLERLLNRYRPPVKLIVI